MNTEKTEKFGTNLKRLRKQKGITQQEIANEINTSRSCISNYESGNRQPDNQTIKLIADFFDVSVDYLFGRSEVKTLIKSNSLMSSIQDVLTEMTSKKQLDISNCSTYVKCAVVEFYTYLLEKEKIHKHKND